jgi:hypothetical protein
VDAGRATPTRATLLLATLASAYALLGTFQQIVAFFICTALVFIALSVGSLFVLRGRRAIGVDVASNPQAPTSILQPRTISPGLTRLRQGSVGQPPRGLVASSSRMTSHLAPRTSDLGTFTCPGHPWTPAAFVLLVIAVVVTVGIARPVEAASGFALVLLGLPAYRLLRFRDDPAERRLAEGAEP